MTRFFTANVLLLAFSLPVGAADVTINTTASLVAEACTINNGTDMYVDFGNLSQKSFMAPNQMPEGIPPKLVTLPIVCDGAPQDAELLIRMNGTAATGNPNALATTNPDLSVGLSSAKDYSDPSTWIPPNTGTLTVKLTGDSAQITFYAVPVRTGNVPAEGLFTSTVTLGVEYP